jgi:hypothetical protein
VHHWHPAFRFGRVELCEANRESGEPGAVSFSTIDWRMQSGAYEGAYSWLPSTWLRQRFPGMPSRAVEATPAQQTRVFRRFMNVGEWPPLALCE